MKLSLLCTMFLLFCFSLRAETSCPKEGIQLFAEQNADYVKNCQDNRVYLKNHCIEVTNGGIYVRDGLNKKIPLTELFSDSQGIYTRLESFSNALATVYPIVWCRTCKAWRMITINGVCGICGNIP